MIDLNNFAEEMRNNLQSISIQLSDLSANPGSTQQHNTKLAPSEKENAMRILEAFLSDHKTATLVVSPTSDALNVEKILITKAIKLANLFEQTWDEIYRARSNSPNPTYNPF